MSTPKILKKFCPKNRTYNVSGVKRPYHIYGTIRINSCLKEKISYCYLEKDALGEK